MNLEGKDLLWLTQDVQRAAFLCSPQSHVWDGPEILGAEAQLPEEAGGDCATPGVPRIYEEGDVLTI